MKTYDLLTSKKTRLYFSTLSWVIFILIFKPIFDVLGTGTAAFAALPVAITGISFGMRSGILSSVGSLVLTTMLLNFCGVPGWDVVIQGGGSIGAVVIFLIGIGSGFIRDLETKRVCGLELLTESENRLGALIENAPIVLFTVDKEGTFTLSEGKGLEKLGIQPGQVVGQSVYDLYKDVPIIIENINAALRGEIRSYTSRVGNLAFDTTVTPMKTTDGKITGILGVATDITDRYLAEEELRKIALLDGMTQLPNREMFMYRLDLAMKRVDKIEGASYFIIYLDLDNFKKANDTLGHAAGDRILIRLGERIESRLRDNDILARIGGDEFAILAEDIVDMSDALVLVDRVMDQIRVPFIIENHKIKITCSIGIYTECNNKLSAEEQLHSADLAMYKVKREGGNGYKIFDETLHKESRAVIEMEERLLESFQRKMMSVHYQPIIDMQEKKLVGVEALIRWDDEQMNDYSTEDIISLACKIGLISKIDTWVLSTACKDLMKFRGNLDSDQKFDLHVNHAAQSLMREDLIEQIGQIIDETEIDPDNLILEITESDFIDRPEQLVERISLLKEKGIRVALDDLGTGYSSLQQLLTLPISRIKIDRQFILGIDQSPSKLAVVEAMIQLSNGLHLEVIAEGVETAKEANVLIDLGCNLVQGYYFNYPMTNVEIMELLNAKPDYPLGNKHLN